MRRRGWGGSGFKEREIVIKGKKEKEKVLRGFMRMCEGIL